ncbi:ERCC4 domain-containing protein [Halorubellus litoreus]|uniref:ERCC4 domain-containing protein n=1 Tax=Halorubellus litoreus TaxID=755308 RepID=A0ABD5VFV5_9EURY
MSDHDFVILHDDREKQPFDFSAIPNVTLETTRLETGDYTTPALEGIAAVERKSLNDLATSLGSDRKRFEAEVKRADRDLQEFVVIVEEPRHLVQKYADAGAKSCPHYFCRTYPRTITSTVDGWPKRYNVRFEFYPDRAYATQATYTLLQSWEQEYGPY